ncbi:hypothetical protein [uncultured Alistipes sp.]|jgi:hypothetical protein|uniref:hypothetical protein n=1 Tax=uncultured Alistipes sp. TaxID=538949 RepID=UPI0025F1D875|nr:hypothetical protein [uncultured Alistipes sp.]
MQDASIISCWNRADFALKFQVCWPGGASGWKEVYSNSKVKSFELDRLDIPDGTYVSVEVSVAGQKPRPSTHVRYKRGSGIVANYSATGPAESFEILLAPENTVSRIACQNHGGFVMKFRVKWNGGQSAYSEKFNISRYRSIDLTRLNIPNGAQVWIEVDVVWGKTRSSRESVIYHKDALGPAVFDVRGTTLNYTITRIE